MVISGEAWPRSFISAGKLTPARTISVAYVCRLFRGRNSRHTFATHLIESGTDLPTLQLLMGHQKLQDTTLYVHLSRRHLHAAVNPLERINIPGLSQKSPEPSE